MRTRLVSGWIAATGALLACAGCGFKGPLYLPERTTVVTHPAPGTKNKQKTPPASPASPTPPTSPPSPSSP
ncbi:MAG: LPS translocon maturation chaperone LptM [Steroidobacteraceae bacterium]